MSKWKWNMRLLPITAGDEALSVRPACDPEMICHIGGLRLEADVRAAHKRRLALMDQGIANAASNAIARKIGMEHQGEFENVGFAGVLRCNIWRINLG